MWKNFFRTLLFLVLTTTIWSGTSFGKPPKKKKNKQIEIIDLDTSTVKATDLILDYKATPTAYFDLIHTKLVLNPNVAEKKLYGTVTIDMKPRFYNQSSVTLDAKGMIINKVVLLKGDNAITLTFNYSNDKLEVKLPYVVTKKDTIKLMIDYVAQPYLLDPKTVEMGRGMYFINPNGTNPYKPTHVWTQGETEAASCWFPTLDNTFQKTTQELYVTVDNKYVTFSNGLLVSSTENVNGTRTDYYRQTQPHAPYLFVLAFGEYKIFKDSWRNKQVNYYTFPKYYDDVQKVFGKTPQMMEYFSSLLGVEYPWDKYDQIIAYDYTAGAMENTGASVFYEPLLSTSRDLIDRDYENIIAHELFHQWFGDLVTCENWSQLTLNESFANYSEQLWLEHSKGKNDADQHWYNDYNDYMKEYALRKKEPIVNFYFETPDKVFDSHRYEKGGRVLHMLRKYVGDDAFFTALNIYLTRYSFKATELDQLRLIFEEVTGEDLNWFFNQWWMFPGHPMLNLEYTYDPTEKTVELKVKQTQKSENTKSTIFKFPVSIDIHLEDSIITRKVWVDQKNESFYFSVPSAPVAVNFDPEKYLLCQTNTYQSAAAYSRVFSTSASILDKIFTLNALARKQNEPEVKALFIKALKDPIWYVRNHTIKILEPGQFVGTELTTVLASIIKTDPNPLVRNDAMALKNTYTNAEKEALALYILDNDSAFFTIASALDALNEVNPTKALEYAKKLKEFDNQRLVSSVVRILAENPEVEDYPYFEKAMFLQFYKNFSIINNAFEKYLLGVDVATFEKGLNVMKIYIENEETLNFKEAVKETIENLKYKLSNNKENYKDAQAKLKLLQ